MKLTITWATKDKSVLEMDPLEYLRASARWTEEAPEREPWLAVCIPTASTEKNISLSLSLDGYHVFSPDAMASFEQVSREILRDCTEEERR